MKSSISELKLSLLKGPHPDSPKGNSATLERRKQWRAETRDAKVMLDMYPRPLTRGECPPERPCPYVSCRHHLYLDVPQDGGLTFPFGEIGPENMQRSCSLDEAELGGMTLDELSERLGGVSRERVRQIEEKALRKFKRRKLELAAMDPEDEGYTSHPDSFVLFNDGDDWSEDANSRPST